MIHWVYEDSTKMTPEEQAYIAQLQAQIKPKRRANMWSFVNQPFMTDDPFSNPSPFDNNNPFFPKRRRI